MADEKFKKTLHDLVKANKIDEALELLSKAQLSELDKVVLALTNQYTRTKNDLMMGTLTRGDAEKTLNKITETVIEISEKVESNHKPVEALKKVVEDKKNITKGNTLPSIEPQNTTPAPLISQPTSTTPTTTPIDLQKLRWLLLLIPLALLILFYRSCSGPGGDIVQNTQTNAGNTSDRSSNSTASPAAAPIAITKAWLKDNSNPWSQFQTVYTEDFSDRHDPDFLTRIWNKKSDAKHWLGVEEDYFAIKIKTTDTNYGRNKYIGIPGYDPRTSAVPAETTVLLSSNSNCRGECLGRGLSVQYTNGRNTGYTFTLNDEGILRFCQMNNVLKPQQKKVLHTSEHRVKSNGRYKLRVVSLDHTFFLYLGDQLLDEITNDTFTGPFDGVYAAGQGEHFFDDVTIYQATHR